MGWGLKKVNYFKYIQGYVGRWIIGGQEESIKMLDRFCRRVLAAHAPLRCARRRFTAFCGAGFSTGFGALGRRGQRRLGKESQPLMQQKLSFVTGYGPK